MQRSILITSVVVALVVVALVVVLANATQVGGPDLSSDRHYDVVSEPSGKVLAMTAVLVDTVPAADMPAAPVDVAGVFVRREDDSVFVGTGIVEVSLGSANGNSSLPEASYDGSLAEVVTTHETRIYQDDTLQQLGGGAPSGPINQVLKSGSLDKIGRISMVSAWGEKRGDRLVVDVLVYANQQFLD